MRLATRVRDGLRDEGVFSLLQSSKAFTFSKVEKKWLQYKYRRKYGPIAPRPNEQLSVDPQNLDYSISAGKMYEDDREYPAYGILSGSWDQHKNPWRESRVWNGLRERFEENRPWEETTYYQWAVDRLEERGEVGTLDGPQTMENLRSYLEYLDGLYRDIKYNGYDPSSVIRVHIGRNGEWIVGHGNHRRTIASILDVDSVPVWITFRHKQWQDRRQMFYQADSVAELPDAEEFLSHPDIPDVAPK